MEAIDIRKLAEQRKSELERRQKEAMGRWGSYIGIVEEHYKQQGRELLEYKKANIAQACDNLFDFYVLNRMNGMISEATTSDAIAFARQMLPTIPALLSSLVADEVAVVQTIDRPQAQVYYMNLKAATARGNVAASSELIGAKLGHASSEGARMYASDYVINETLAIGNGSTANYASTTARKPVIAGTLVITDGVETFTDDGSGVMVTDTSGGTNGTIVYATGAYDVTFKTNVVNLVKVYGTYRYNVESDTSGIGGIDFEVTAENVDAMVFPIKLNYNVFSAINLQKFMVWF